MVLTSTCALTSLGSAGGSAEGLGVLISSGQHHEQQAEKCCPGAAGSLPSAGVVSSAWQSTSNLSRCQVTEGQESVPGVQSILRILCDKDVCSGRMEQVQVLTAQTT